MAFMNFQNSGKTIRRKFVTVSSLKFWFYSLIGFSLNQRVVSFSLRGIWSAKVGQVRVLWNISDWFRQQIDARKVASLWKSFSRSLSLKHAEKVKLLLCCPLDLLDFLDLQVGWKHRHNFTLSPKFSAEWGFTLKPSKYISQSCQRRASPKKVGEKLIKVSKKLFLCFHRNWSNPFVVRNE